MLGVYALAAVLACAAAGPVANQPPTFIGQGTDTLASCLLKDYNSEDGNVVFSPLGLNTLLAIFAEGARSDTRDEIATALHFPPDQLVVRQTYQTVLRRLSVKYENNIPELKNWFYVYKNNSVEPALVENLREYYLTDVKYVEPLEYFTSQTKVQAPAGLQGKPTDHLIDPDKEVQGIIQSSASGLPHKSDGEEANSNQSPALFDAEKQEEHKMAPNKTVVPQPMEEQENPLKENEPETKKKMDSEKKPSDEVMVAMQRSLEGHATADDMNGLTDSAVKISKGSTHQMVVFNGLYYKGEWDTQFVKLPADDDRPFYKANNEKVFVNTLQANGVFATAECPELNSRAVELKYVGGRYSLLLVVPNEKDGLSQLINQLTELPISRIYNRLSEKLLDVCLPTFQITSTTKPVSASKKGGIANINKLFNPDTANLSGISQDSGLFVEEIVQLVTFKADSNYTEANFLTASIAATRTESLDKFAVNQPFLFYLRDNIDGIVVVSGKVTDPTPTHDEFTNQSLRNSVHVVMQ